MQNLKKICKLWFCANSKSFTFIIFASVTFLGRFEFCLAVSLLLEGFFFCLWDCRALVRVSMLFFCSGLNYFRFGVNHVCSRYSHYFDVLFCSSSFTNKLFICIVEAVEKKVLRWEFVFSQLASPRLSLPEFLKRCNWVNSLW